MKSLELKGEWCHPKNTEERSFGTLNFNPNVEPSLELYDSLSELDFTQSEEYLLLGNTVENERVTLPNCFYVGRFRSLISDRGEKTNVSNFLLKDILIGKHFKEKPILFDRIINSSEWGLKKIQWIELLSFITFSILASIIPSLI